MTFHLTCVHIILVRFGLLNGQLLENSYSLGRLHVYVNICNFSPSLFGFCGLDLGSVRFGLLSGHLLGNSCSLG